MLSSDTELLSSTPSIKIPTVFVGTSSLPTTNGFCFNGNFLKTDEESNVLLYCLSKVNVCVCPAPDACKRITLLLSC